MQEQAITISLLVVESILLIATIILLLLTKKEWKMRERALKSLQDTIRVLTRQQYFSTVMEALRSSKKEVKAIVTGTYPRDEDQMVFDELLKCIKEASSRGVKLQYLMPKGKDKLAVGSKYVNSGAEVRYHDGLIVYDLRYMVVDGELMVLGLPEKVGEVEPTRVGHLVKSETLANLLISHFERYWETSIEYREYLKRTVDEIRKAEPGASKQLIAAYLRVNEVDIEI